MDELSYESLEARPLRALSQLGSVREKPSFEFPVAWDTNDINNIEDTLLGAEETIIGENRESMENAWAIAFGSRQPNMPKKYVTLLFSRDDRRSHNLTIVRIENCTVTLEDGTVVDPIIKVHINLNDYAQKYLVVTPEKEAQKIN